MMTRNNIKAIYMNDMGWRASCQVLDAGMLGILKKKPQSKQTASWQNKAIIANILLDFLYCIIFELIINCVISMGTGCSEECKEEKSFEIVGPTQSTFVKCNPVKIPQRYETFLNKVKKIINFYDSREQKNLSWFKSIKYDFYLYGEVKNGKPFNECLIYSPLEHVPQMPIIISTKIDKQNTFSPQTLIVYADLSYYWGQIFSRPYQFPRASGKGLLVNREFIYEGQFNGGLPNGHGYFKTKSLEYVGQFKNGQPCGEGVERSKCGLFIGEILANQTKKGILITPQNKKKQINEESQFLNDRVVEDEFSIVI